MVAIFPIGKLVYLGIKQVSKPIARALQNYARGNKLMRDYVCTPPAQGNVVLVNLLHQPCVVQLIIGYRYLYE